MTTLKMKDVLINAGCHETYDGYWSEEYIDDRDNDKYSLSIEEAYLSVVNKKVEISIKQLCDASSGLKFDLSYSVPNQIMYMGEYYNNVIVYDDGVGFGLLENYITNVWVSKQQYKMNILNKIKKIIPPYNTISFITKFEHKPTVVKVDYYLDNQHECKSVEMMLDPMPWLDKFILSESDIYEY